MSAVIKFFDLPGLVRPNLAHPLNTVPYWMAPNLYYGTPHDFNGNAALGLDLRGQPYWINDDSVLQDSKAGFAETNERLWNPYQFDLSLPGGAYDTGSGVMASIDEPFSVEEMERLLRFGDLDASSLPDRIVQLAPLAFVNDPSDPVAAPN